MDALGAGLLLFQLLVNRIGEVGDTLTYSFAPADHAAFQIGFVHHPFRPHGLP
jgi:hypothetical protein